MITEQELLDFINKQMKANKDHLEFTEKRLGRDWVIENSEIEYYQGANTAPLRRLQLLVLLMTASLLNQLKRNLKNDE